MYPLDDRKRRILKAIVTEHIETAEPVGSEVLVGHYDLGVRSATIRNEMSAMSDMGYLKQPHTSAGRVPSDLGYRFYVDRLMEGPFMPRSDAASARSRLGAVSGVLDDLIAETCRILSALTSCASVATQPMTGDCDVSHIHLSVVGDRKLLVVVGLSDGRVLHRVVGVSVRPSGDDVARATSQLSSRFCGRRAGSLGHSETIGVQEMSQIYTEAEDAFRRMVRDVWMNDGDVWVEGANNVVRQPEFRDPDKMDRVLALLDERRRLYQFLSRMILGPDVTIVIGSENPFSEMSDTSFVAANYRIGNRVAGTIAVVGATRMDYRRAVSAVQVMAGNLGELLTELSLE